MLWHQLAVCVKPATTLKPLTDDVNNTIMDPTQWTILHPGIWVWANCDLSYRCSVRVVPKEFQGRALWSTIACFAAWHKSFSCRCQHGVPLGC